MTSSKYELIAAFLDGEESPPASRESIEYIGGVPCIVGYGWAVYAVDMGDYVALFGDGYASKGDNVGWAGYSGQTTQHLQEIKGMLHDRGVPYTVVDAQLRMTRGWAAPGHSDRPVLKEMDDADLSAFIEDNEVEPRDGEGYTTTLKRAKAAR